MCVTHASLLQLLYDFIVVLPKLWDFECVVHVCECTWVCVYVSLCGCDDSLLP